MNFKIWSDDVRGVTVLEVIHMLTADDVNVIMPGINELLEGKHPRHVLVNLTSNPSGFLDAQARKTFRSYADAFEFDKIAMFGADHRIRMLAKAAVFALGKSNITRFFKDEEQALRWLKKQ